MQKTLTKKPLTSLLLFRPRALIEPAYELGIENTCATILSGVVTRKQYCVGQPDATGKDVVADAHSIDSGNVHGGIFVTGFNAICITFEVTLGDWLPLDTD